MTPDFVLFSDAHLAFFCPEIFPDTLFSAIAPAHPGPGVVFRPLFPGRPVCQN